METSTINSLTHLGILLALLFELVACSSSGGLSPDLDIAVKPCEPGYHFDSNHVCVSSNSVNDNFAAAQVSGWIELNPSLTNAEQANGKLTLSLSDNALWFNNSRGGLLYKQVTGDFTITALVRTTGVKNDTAPPPRPIRFAGIMVRSPESDEPGARENYVHLVAGRSPLDPQTNTSDPVVEWKSTVESISGFSAGQPSSGFDSVSWSGDAVRLRIRRECNQITYLKRDTGDASYIEIMNVSREDLPATVQVGLNIYTTASGPIQPPDLKGTYNWFEYVELENSRSQCSER